MTVTAITFCACQSTFLRFLFSCRFAHVRQINDRVGLVLLFISYGLRLIKVSRHLWRMHRALNHFLWPDGLLEKISVALALRLPFGVSGRASLNRFWFFPISSVAATTCCGTLAPRWLAFLLTLRRSRRYDLAFIRLLGTVLVNLSSALVGRFNCRLGCRTGFRL